MDQTPTIWLEDKAAFEMGYGRPPGRSGPTNHELIYDLAHVTGGRANKPKEPIVITAWDGVTPIILAGLGEAEGAQLEDLAIEAHERSQEEGKRSGQAQDYQRIREMLGVPSKEQFMSNWYDSLEWRVDQHLKNPRTDPAKKRTYEDPNKAVFSYRTGRVT